MLSELTTDIQYPNFPTYSAHFNYDAYDRVTSMTDKSGARSYTYDDLDIVGSVTTTYTGLPARTVSYSYNTDGSLASIGTPVGAFTYAYDDLGRTTALTNPFMETFSWIYGNDYSLSSQILKNAAGTVIAQTDYAYDNRGYLVALTNKQADGTTLSGFSGPNGALQYDTAGNLTSLTATIPGAPTLSGTTTNTYDWQNQLLNEQTTRNGGYNYSFAYDLAGNPTSFKGQTRGFNDQNQNTAFTFDLNGNPTSYKGNTLTYDPSDHLTGFGGLFTAGYGIGGHRVWKEYNGSRTYFLYADGVPICEMDSAGNVIATNTFGVNGLLNRHDGSGTAFYTFDPQGNVVQQLNSMGTVTSTSMYDAYGSRLTTTPVSPFGYGGQSGYYTDPETGLVLLTHRYYDPQEGRFLTRDPIGWAGGINLYAYVHSNPVNHTDSLGLDGDDDLIDHYTAMRNPALWLRAPWTSAANDEWNSHLGAIGAADYKSATPIGSAAFKYGAMKTGEIVGAFAGLGPIGDLAGLAAEGLEGALAAGGEGVAEGVAEESAEAAADVADGTGCFVAGTLVATPDGPKPIEQITPRDTPYSYDSETPSLDELVNRHHPIANDTVLVLDKGMAVVGSALVNALRTGDRVLFEGRVYEAKTGTGSTRGLVYTGIVTSRVARAFMRKVGTLVDLVVRSTDGKDTVISGTTEHPFYVPAVDGYVAMARLTPGTVLKAVDGSTVSVVGSTERHGSFTVHNFEVEGQHNYYVSDAQVLVHNGCGDNFPHYRPNPDGEGPYTLLRPRTDGEVGWSNAQTYDGEGYGVRRIDFMSRSGRADHPFPHYHEFEWAPNSRNPWGGVPKIPKVPTPGLPY